MVERRRAPTAVQGVDDPAVAGCRAVPTVVVPVEVRRGPVVVPMAAGRGAPAGRAAVPIVGVARVVAVDRAAVPTGRRGEGRHADPEADRGARVVARAVPTSAPEVRRGPTVVRSEADRQAVPTVDRLVVVPRVGRTRVGPTWVVLTSGARLVVRTWARRRSVPRVVAPTVDRLVVVLRVGRTWVVLTSGARLVVRTWARRRSVPRVVAPTGLRRVRPKSVRCAAAQAAPTVDQNSADRDPADRDPVDQDPAARPGRVPARDHRVREAAPDRAPNRSTVHSAERTRGPAVAAAVAGFHPGATAWECRGPVHIGRRPAEAPAEAEVPAGRTRRPVGNHRLVERAAHRIADTVAHPLSVGYRTPRNCCCPSAGLQAEVSIYRHDAVELEPPLCRRLSTVPYRRNVGVGLPQCRCLPDPPAPWS